MYTTTEQGKTKEGSREGRLPTSTPPWYTRDTAESEARVEMRVRWEASVLESNFIRHVTALSLWENFD